ncbi:MAG: hypothetical protein AAFO06_14005 [Cyanobacteria bacterium J06597_16]
MQTAVSFTLAQATAQPPATDPPTTVSSALVDQLERLNAAALTLDEEGSPEDRINRLRRLAKGYGEIGEQERALQLLNQAVLIAEQIKAPPLAVAVPDDNASDEASDNSSEPTTATEYFAAQQAERDAEPSALAQRYVRAIARIAPDYSRLGDTKTAQNLLEQATETSLTLTGRYRSGGSELDKIVKAYTLIEEADVTEAGLLTLLDLVTDLEGPAWKNSNGPYIPKGMVEGFAQLENAAVANEGLSRLYETKLAMLEASTAENKPDGLSIRTLTQFAIAHSQQNNADTAEALMAQAIEVIRNSDLGIRDLQTIGLVAEACGYLPDAAAGEQKLAELQQIIQTVELFPDQGELSEEETLMAASRDLYYQISPLASVAIAYSKLGNLSKAQAIIAPIVDIFPANASSILDLERLAQIYELIGDVPSQQAILKTLFALLPELKEISSSGLNISDVTPGYLGVNSLWRGYVATEDDAIAQTRLSALEDFFKDIRFAEQGFSGQLSTLASAAMARGDEASAHRLMIEAMELVTTPDDQLIPDDPRFNAARAVSLGGETFEQDQTVSVLSSLVKNYGTMQNEHLKAAGLEAIRQTAARKVETAERRARIEDVITWAYAGL